MEHQYQLTILSTQGAVIVTILGLMLVRLQLHLLSLVGSWLNWNCNMSF